MIEQGWYDDVRAQRLPSETPSPKVAHGGIKPHSAIDCHRLGAWGLHGPSKAAVFRVVPGFVAQSEPHSILAMACIRPGNGSNIAPMKKDVSQDA